MFRAGRNIFATFLILGTLWIFLNALYFLVSEPDAYGASKWKVIQSNVTNHLLDVKSLGYGEWIVVGESTILKSFDNGETWGPKDAPLPDWFRESVFVGDTGVIVGGGTPTYSSMILRTVDRGNSYDINVVGNKLLYAVSYTGSRFVTTGAAGTVFSSTDGRTWADESFSDQAEILSVDFSGRNGLAVGYLNAEGTLFRTVDGGSNWTRIYLPVPMCMFYSVAYVDSTTAYVVGGSAIRGSGMVLKTTDSGETWETYYTTQRQSYLTSVAFANPWTAIAVGWDGVIFSTNNGGRWWFEEESPTTETLWSVSIANNQAIAVGSNGTILKLSQVTNVETMQKPKQSGISISGYPNPFNSQIKLSVLVDRQGTYRIDVYNLLGQSVSGLFLGSLLPGPHFFTFAGTNLSTGSYICRLEGEGKMFTYLFTLIK